MIIIITDDIEELYLYEKNVSIKFNTPELEKVWNLHLRLSYEDDTWSYNIWCLKALW